MKFRGMDAGKSKFRQEAARIERIEFPDNVTIRKIFKSKEEKKQQDQDGQQEKESKKPMMTAFGEVVYQRAPGINNTKKEKLTNFGEKDEVLEENLMDVKNLLKNATSS